MQQNIIYVQNLKKKKKLTAEKQRVEWLGVQGNGGGNPRKVRSLESNVQPEDCS